MSTSESISIDITRIMTEDKNGNGENLRIFCLCANHEGMRRNRVTPQLINYINSIMDRVSIHFTTCPSFPHKIIPGNHSMGG